MSSPLRISVARPADWPAAARWTFAHIREPFAGLRADRLVALLVDGEIAPAGVFLATGRGAAVGGLVVQHLPGGTAVVLLPGGESEAVRDALVAAAVDRFPAAGVAVAQAFVDPLEDDRAAVLTRHAFQAVTTVLSMARDPSDAPLPLPRRPDPNVRLVPFAEADRGTFARTLLATYRDSLDVPEANAGRSAEEVLAGYLFGQPDPPHWWLATGPTGVPLGVMLLSAGAVLDLTYLGVVPEARGRGVGGTLLRVGLTAAREAGRSMILTVDERNRPARRLYDAHGFQSVRWQRVYLWLAGL